jgi:hypothetical protein
MFFRIRGVVFREEEGGALPRFKCHSAAQSPVFKRTWNKGESRKVEKKLLWRGDQNICTDYKVIKGFLGRGKRRRD